MTPTIRQHRQRLTIVGAGGGWLAAQPLGVPRGFPRGFPRNGAELFPGHVSLPLLRLPAQSKPELSAQALRYAAATEALSSSGT